MVFPIVLQVTALAERGQIRRVVVGRVLVQMGTGQNRFDKTPFRPFRSLKNVRWLALAIVPLPGVRIDPTPVFDDPYGLAMRTATPLAPPFGTFEFDSIRQLSPVRRVQGTKVGMDGHHLIAHQFSEKLFVSI